MGNAIQTVPACHTVSGMSYSVGHVIQCRACHTVSGMSYGVRQPVQTVSGMLYKWCWASHRNCAGMPCKRCSPTSYPSHKNASKATYQHSNEGVSDLVVYLVWAVCIISWIRDAEHRLVGGLSPPPPPARAAPPSILIRLTGGDDNVPQWGGLNYESPGVRL